MTAPGNRLASLDAIRGIASFAVILSHCYITLPDDIRLPLTSSTWLTPLHIIHNGDAAVIIFFVLSGYVLSLPFFRGTQPSYSGYVLKRVCRIYIPFVVSILFAATLYSITDTQNVLNASEWFNSLWPLSPTLHVLAAHLSMTGTEPDISLNPIMWSLVYEMRLSLIFPLLMILCRDTRYAVMAALLMLVISTKILTAVGQSGHPARVQYFWCTLLWTLKLAPHFIIGILLSKHSALIKAVSQIVTDRARFALLAVPISIIFSMQHSYVYAKTDLMYGVGAAMVIVLSLELPRITAFLETVVLQWLGRISYSLYLFHFPILLLVGHTALPYAGFILFSLAVIVTSLGVATVTNMLVEVPAIRLGKRLAQRARPTVPDATITPPLPVDFPPT